MGEENMHLTVEELNEDLKILRKKDYIKEGWLDDFEEKDFSEKNGKLSILDCINDCTSPAADNNEEKLKAIFRAFSLFPMKNTEVLVIGQDPYPSEKYPGMADGLAFSQNHVEKAVDSLLNIFKAIKVYKYREKENLTKYFCDIDSDEVLWETNLKSWALKNNILLLNTTLTHKDKNTIEQHRKVWEKFVQQIIKNLISYKLEDNDNKKLAVFLWGKDAQITFLKCLNNNDLSRCLDVFKSKCANFTLKEKDFKLINENITINKNIKVYMTSHPSNNWQAVKHGFCCNSPKHFKACDEFLGKNEYDKFTWLDFPETKNNK